VGIDKIIKNRLFVTIEFLKTLFIFQNFMHLPFEDLSTNKLAASFANTVATYKFYWLIAIISREWANQDK
jgi:hypothetical protein